MRSGRGAAALDPPQMTRRRRPGSQLQAFGLTTSCCWSPAEITIGSRGHPLKPEAFG
jgi:hypothetical protein